MDLICVGDVMVDVHARAGELARGGDVHGRVLIRPGGSSANAAVWAAWSGAAAAIVAAVGEDVAGRLCVDALRDNGVDVSGIVRRPGSTGVMLVVTQAGDRSMVADRGANAALTAADLPPLEAGAVLVSGYLFLQEPGHETALAALARGRGRIVAIEAASWPLVEAFGVERFLDEAAGCHAVLANEREAEVLTGRTGADAARALGERFRFAAVKLGERGAALSADGVLFERAAEPVTERDPTGAGDAFDGALLAALARGVEPEPALAAACRAGVLVAASRETWPESRERAGS
jgi:sugar/nucleoside kinase (ribokinase family)